MKTAPHPSLPFSLYFDEDAHRYLVDTEKSIEYWQPLPSVTQFVGHYIPPFDAQKAAVCKADAVACLWTVGDSFGATMEWHISADLGKRLMSVDENYKVTEVD